MNKIVFDIQHVSYRYDEVVALNDITLRVTTGQRVALLGPNGSGKSTLLRLLDALCFADSGTVSFDGETLDRKRFEDDRFHFGFRQKVGLVFQNPDVQLFNPTVYDEVAFGPLQLRWPAEKIRRKTGEILERMEIVHLKDRSPHRLSGGEKKKVSLASIFVLDPDVLLLDEPTAALDPRCESRIIDLLIGWGDGKKTVITATHDLGLVEDIADCCFVLQNGSVLAEGRPAEILGDEDLLLRANLVHAHRHRHLGGKEHSHPHSHPLPTVIKLYH